MKASIRKTARHQVGKIRWRASRADVWRAAWQASRILCSTIGLVVLVAWFVNLKPVLALASAIALAAGWYVLYLLARGISLRRADRATQPQRILGSEAAVAAEARPRQDYGGRRRHVAYTADGGELLGSL